MTRPTKALDMNKKQKILDWGVFALLLLFVSAVTFLLFYRQVYGNPGYYHSDMKAYILEIQGLNTKYQFPYPIFFMVGKFFHLFLGPELSVALATLLLNSLAIFLMKGELNRLVLDKLQNTFEKQKWFAGVLVSLAAVSLFFISMLFPPKGLYLPGIKFNYLGVFSANPWHNATYMAARPFTILAFFQYVRLLDVYEEGWKGKERDYILFALYLLLATMTKPSFTLVLVGAAGLLMVWRMAKSRFRNFLPTLQLGLCFVPTFADLLYQYRGVFVPAKGQEGGVGFALGDVWKLYCDNIPLAVAIGAAFPLLVLVLNYKELKTNTLFRFSWQLYFMGFAMAFLLYEKGFRQPDFNFCWGYMAGIFFAFTGSITVLLQKTACKKHPVLLAAQWLAYLWHLICGIYYFIGIFGGAMYY